MLANKELPVQIMDTIDIILEACNYLLDEAYENSYTMFISRSNDISKGLDLIYSSTIDLKEETIINIPRMCKNITYSLQEIIKYYDKDIIKLKNKLEYELIPLVKDMKQDFYYWCCVYPDEEKLINYYESERIPLSCNEYVDNYEKRDQYKYDLSIIIIAYNKLDYTKLCVNSLLKHLPKNINYEIILINHGSTDGTKEYFESLHPTKQLDILENGWGLSAVKRIVEGKYVLAISNDVLVTENAISNMLKCIKSDNKIAKVVPTTTNVSNFQSIVRNFSNLDKMYEFSSENNVSDMFRWEQRTRLCDPISLSSSKIFYSSSGVIPATYYIGTNLQLFPDDKCSLILRRNGYKLLLAKDSFCYHFGSITLRDEIKKSNEHEYYNEGRKSFAKTFGVDAWGTGFCWDYYLFEQLKCDCTGHVDVLGINCGMGSNSLKVREKIKEDVKNLDVYLYNVTDEMEYYKDLVGISDRSDYFNNCYDSIEKIEGKYNYIIFDGNIEKYKNILSMLQNIFDKLLKQNGYLCIKTKNSNIISNLKFEYEKITTTENWIILSKNSKVQY
ncbi:glycosyltransferase [Sedimentibacter sp. zth1]|uniref:glycosyltransferase n=1 Tax=Sedimentibacter sp. zth1 TaxID=2816908 RepID=UPI001A92F8A7|nr:glycosyltransferase [Sedimentibacter sp. zth1]QSX07152.1 glycosyltransferase [Sedimentibacter sp. zth1]